MKKLVFMLFAATLLGMAFVSCGDEKDEPVIPKPQTLESEHQDATETYFKFDIDMNRDSSSIYLYNVVFTIGEAQSPAMNIRIDAPVTVDKKGKVFTYSGTNITPFLLRGNTPVPMPNMPVTDLTCTVNTGDKTYSMAFDCHGGHYSNSGKLK